MRDKETPPQGSSDSCQGPSLSLSSGRKSLVLSWTKFARSFVRTKEKVNLNVIIVLTASSNLFIPNF